MGVNDGDEYGWVEIKEMSVDEKDECRWRRWVRMEEISMSKGDECEKKIFIESEKGKLWVRRFVIKPLFGWGWEWKGKKKKRVESLQYNH